MSLILLALSASFAQEPTPAEELPETIEAATIGLEKELSSLRGELEACAASVEEAATDAGRAEDLLSRLAALQRTDASEQERIGAIEAIAHLEDERAIPFLAAELAQGSSPVRATIGRVVRVWPAHPEAMRIARKLAEDSIPEVYGVGMSTIESLADDPEAVDLLVDLVSNRRMSAPHRDAARQTLERRYPTQAAALQVEKIADRGALQMFAIGTAITGATTLGFVGSLGKSEVGIGVGLTGGTLAGGAGGALYADRQHLSMEDATQSTLAVAWGGYGSAMTLAIAADACTGWCRPSTESGFGITAVGTAAGLALAAADKNPASLSDQAETHLGGLIGTAAGLGVAGLYVEAAQPRNLRALSIGSVVGSAAGLTAGRALQPVWHIERSNGHFAALSSAQGIWLGSIAPVLVTPRDRTSASAATLAGAIGLTSGLVISELRPPSDKAVGGNFVGWLAGNALGSGLAMATQPWDAASADTTAGAMLAAGTTGAALGHAIGPALTFDQGDVAFTSMSTLWLTGNAVSLGSIASAKTNVHNPGAVTMTTFGLALPLTAGLSQLVDPKPGDVLLATSAGGWGLWYGAMVPLAVDASGDGSDLLLAMTLTSDAFVLGAIGLSAGTDLPVSRTAVPQLVAVGGATTGALVASLITSDGSDIATGSVIGSTVGMVGGALLESRRKTKPKKAASLGAVHLPGQWMPTVSPLASSDGAPGVLLGLQATGW